LSADDTNSGCITASTVLERHDDTRANSPLGADADRYGGHLPRVLSWRKIATDIETPEDGIRLRELLAWCALVRRSAAEMISLRLAVPAVLGAAALAGFLTYFVTPPPSVEANQQLLPAERMLEADMRTPKNVDRRPSAEERAASFQQPAEAILKQATAAQQPAEVQEASAGTDEPAITWPIPLPRRRPIPRGP
jgi:hypothetical protein